MTTVTTDLPSVLNAATALERAARFDVAIDLLDSVAGLGDQDRLALLMSRARVVAARDHVRGRRTDGVGPHPLADVLALADEVGTGPSGSWDVAMLVLRRDYADALLRDDGSPWFGPEGRAEGEVDRMLAEAQRLRDAAPDQGRRGWALMCLGWFSDNLRGDREAAPAYYAEALSAGRALGDDLLVFEAQRHLGDHAHDEGDHRDAAEAWEESTTAAARAGYLSGVLAQQLLLAVLARDAGNEPGARALAVEVGRWSAAIGATQRVRQVEQFLVGVDPTRAPEDAQARS
jgi:hypothetical protein